MQLVRHNASLGQRVVAVAHLAQVDLEPPHEHLLQAPQELGLFVGVVGYGLVRRKAVLVEQMQKLGKTAPVAVVRCRREKQPMLKPRRQSLHRLQQIPLICRGIIARRCRVVGLVEHQHRAQPRLTAPLQPILKRLRVRLHAQPLVRNHEPRVQPPRVNLVAVPPPRRLDPLGIVDLERQAEFVLHLFDPLLAHVGRRRHHNAPQPLPTQQFAHD